MAGMRTASETSPDTEYIDSLEIIGYVYTGIAFLSSIGFAVWTHCNAKTRVVKASQPIFLGLICMGAFITSSSIIPITVENRETSQRVSDGSCMAFPWLLWPGFVLMYAAMFSKTWRASKVINSARHYQRVKVTAFDVMVPLVVLMTIVIVLLICWTVTAPLYLVISDEGYRECKTDQPAFPITVSSVFNVTFIVTGFQAWRARNISAEFSESRYIGMIMIISLAVSATTNVLVFTRENNKLNFVAGATVIFIHCMIVLLLIFVPKIISLRIWRQKNQRPGTKETATEQPEASTGTATEQPSSTDTVTANESCDTPHGES